MSPTIINDERPVAADFLLYGWRVQSELPVPEGLAWNDSERPVDINIRLGKVPDALDEPIQVTPFLQIAGNGDCRLEIATAGRYLIRQGREVIVQPAPTATSAEINLFLFGSVLGLLCHQRGLFPLHASCVRIGDGAVAFCGSSGAGKSTLAASLVQRGHLLVSDDVTAIDTASVRGPLVLPGVPRMRLWLDSLEALAVPSGQLERDRIELQKYAVPVTKIGGFLRNPLPLKAIFMLRSTNMPDLDGALPIQPMETIAQLTEHIYRRRHAFALGRQQELFHETVRIKASVPIKCLARQLDLGQLDAVATMVEELVGT